MYQFTTRYNVSIIFECCLSDIDKVIVQKSIFTANFKQNIFSIRVEHFFPFGFDQLELYEALKENDEMQ